MSGSGREALPNVWEWLETFLDVREWSGGTPACARVVRTPFRKFGSGREAFSDVREALPVVR